MKRNPLYYSSKVRKAFLTGLKNLQIEVRDYPCPFPCNGHIRELLVEKSKEITTPPGFKQQRQYMCNLCGITFFGTSNLAVSKLIPNHVQLRAWRINRSHGRWIEKGWRGRKYVFDGYQ